jgi:DNA-directed RNA polymerase subunit omega
LAERHDTMMNPHIEGLLNRTNSKFRLVTLASQRARQINAYFGHLGDGLGTTVPPQVTSLARKPLSIAFEEIAADKIVGIAADPVDELGGFDVSAFDPATFEGTYEGEGQDAAEVPGAGMEAEDAPDAGASPEADGPAVEA